MSRLTLIAHRGEPETWPENSLAGFAGVLAAGARHIETDVQFVITSYSIHYTKLYEQMIVAASAKGVNYSG